MNKAIFLDRDGTINVDYGYNSNPERLVLIDRVAQNLKRLSEAGFLLIIITNQSGIGRGYYTLTDFESFQAKMDEMLSEAGVSITDVFYCPHVSEDMCECRKPKLKLYYDAKEKYSLDLSQSFAVGDKKRDLAICKSEPVRGILLSDCKDNEYSSFSSWDEIADFILNA